MEVNYNKLRAAGSMDQLRNEFLEVTRIIFISNISSEEKQMHRKESERIFDDVKALLLKNAKS